MVQQQLDKAMGLLMHAIAANWIPPDMDWWNKYFELTGERTFPPCCHYKTAYGRRQLVITKTAILATPQQRYEKALNLLNLAVCYDAIPPEDNWFREFYSLTGAHMLRIEAGWIVADSLYDYSAGRRPEVFEEINKPVG